MVWRPFYFANLIVDPKNPDRLFKTDGALIMSEDAGRASRWWADFKGRTATRTMSGSIQPIRKRSLSVDDGGMWYSYNSGSKWWKGNNRRCRNSHVSVDDNDP